MNKEQLEIRKLAAVGTVGQKSADTPVAIRLRYIGAGTVTSVIVTTATDVTMITSDGGTDAYLFSSYATVGALVDAINAAGIFEAKVLDSLRSYATATQFKAETITLLPLMLGAGASESVWDIKVDTSAAKYVAYRLTYDRGFSKSHKKGHRVNLQEIEYFGTLGTAAEDMVQVHEVYGTVESKIFGRLSVSAAAQTLNWAAGEGSISALDGNDLVVVLKDGTSLSDTALSLTVTGIVE